MRRLLIHGAFLPALSTQENHAHQNRHQQHSPDESYHPGEHFRECYRILDLGPYVVRDKRRCIDGNRGYLHRQGLEPERIRTAVAVQAHHIDRRKLIFALRERLDHETALERVAPYVALCHIQCVDLPPANGVDVLDELRLGYLRPSHQDGIGRLIHGDAVFQLVGNQDGIPLLKLVQERHRLQNGHHYDREQFHRLWNRDLSPFT